MKQGMHGNDTTKIKGAAASKKGGRRFASASLGYPHVCSFRKGRIGSTAKAHLTNALHQRAYIEALLLFLQHLDELEKDKPGIATCLDLACIFDDIAETAKEGALSIRQFVTTLPRDTIQRRPRK